jgi:electron transfer flavoprotein alpha/beta subunit
MPADRAVLELAADGFPGGAEVYCVTADDAALHYALAAGASRVDVLSDLQTVRAQWVLVGPGSLAEHGDWLPAALAEQLAAALVFDVQEILRIDANSMIVRRDLGSGDRDELVVSAPAVLVFADQLAPTRYVSRFRQRAVRARFPKQDGEELPNPLLRLTGEWETVRPRVRPAAEAVGGSTTAEDRTSKAFGLAAEGASSRNSRQPLQADPATCAAHLVRYLSHHGLLPRAISALPSPPGRDRWSSGSSRPVGPDAARASGQPTGAGAQGRPPSPPTPLPGGEGGTEIGRGPRLRGEITPARQARQPRRLQEPSQVASSSSDIARRPRRAGSLAPERNRGPRPHPC